MGATAHKRRSNLSLDQKKSLSVEDETKLIELLEGLLGLPFAGPVIQASEASYGFITRLKKAVVCSTTPPRALVLAAPKGVQSIQLGVQNVLKGSWTSPS